MSRKKHEIVIIVSGGMVQKVYSTNKKTVVHVADEDNRKNGSDDELLALDDATAWSKQGDMYEVY